MLALLVSHTYIQLINKFYTFRYIQNPSLLASFIVVWV